MLHCTVIVSTQTYKLVLPCEPISTWMSQMCFCPKDYKWSIPRVNKSNFSLPVHGVDVQRSVVKLRWKTSEITNTSLFLSPLGLKGIYYLVHGPHDSRRIMVIFVVSFNCFVYKSTLEISPKIELHYLPIWYFRCIRLGFDVLSNYFVYLKGLCLLFSTIFVMWCWQTVWLN